MAELNNVVVLCNSPLDSQKIVHSPSPSPHPRSSPLSQDIFGTSIQWNPTDRGFNGTKTVENKYFAASLSLNLLPLSESSSVFDSAHGVIIFVDSSDDWKSLESLQSKFEGTGPELGLLVATSPFASEEETSQFIEWTLEYGFEFVDHENSRYSLDFAFVLSLICNSPSDEREKFGLERVYESILNTMWPNVEMKGDRSSNLPSPSQHVDIFVNEENNGEEIENEEGTLLSNCFVSSCN